MARVIVPEAEELLDKPISVLDHGFVRLVDYMGGDERIVQAARVSYGKGTKTKREDAGLIRYLMRNDHWTPFEQVQLTFHVKLPIFVARQWIRHRTARVNEISARYSVMEDEFYIPDADRVLAQSKRNKQGGEGDLAAEVRDDARARLERTAAAAYADYTRMIEAGVARETARTVLPVSLYTQWYWQSDLRNLLHFIRLRADAHAQYEIQVYARALAVCAKAVAPIAWAAYEEYVGERTVLSAAQSAELARVLYTHDPELARRLGLAEPVSDAPPEGTGA